MSLSELFLRESNEYDSSLISLPQDLDLWAETIITHVKEKLPASKNMSLNVSFMKKDEEMGVATGAVEVKNTKLNKTLYIPIVAKNFKMFPLDILMVPDKSNKNSFETIPLTNKTFEEYFFSVLPFDSLTRPLDRLSSLYGSGMSQGNLVLPPTYRSVHASAQVIDSLEGTIPRSDIEAFKNSLHENKDSLVGYEKRSNLDVLKKIVGIKVAETVKKPILKNISIIKKDSSNNYNVMTVSDQAFDPITEDIDKSELRYNLDDKVERAADTLNEIERNGEKIVFTDLKPDNDAYILTDPTSSPVSNLPKDSITFGRYQVQDKNGVFHKGTVIPNMIDFDMKKLPYKIFVSNQKSAFQTKILGTPLEDQHPMKEIPFRELKIGVTGSFVFIDKKNAIATYPVTIKSIMNDRSYDPLFVCEKLDGTLIKVKHDNTLGESKSLARIAKLDGVYLLPRPFKFIPMENLSELVEDPFLYVIKEASRKVSANPVRVIHRGYDQFSLKGPDMTKMAQRLSWDPTHLNPVQTAFLLASKRCPLKKVALALSYANKKGECYIHGLPHVNWDKGSSTKLAYSKFDSIFQLRKNLIKEASFFEDSQIVDNVLSLNFINPQNVEKFVNFIPLFKNTGKALAESLLASRLGMSEIPPQATSTAMMKLMEVIEGLEKLKLQDKKD